MLAGEGWGRLAGLSKILSTVISVAAEPSEIEANLDFSV